MAESQPRQGSVHWIRPLKRGGVEFYMRAEGQTMKGDAGSHATYRDLRGYFEQHVGVTLPPPEEKPMRGRADVA